MPASSHTTKMPVAFAFLTCPLLGTKGLAVVIADGVSGSGAGREASAACVYGFLNDYFSTPESWSVKTSGQRVLGALNRWLCGQTQHNYATDSHHVLKIIEPDSRCRFLYYTTEYIEGQTLRTWMVDNPRPTLSAVRNLIEQLVAGLRAFHRLEMVHRDLKPENILIDTTQTVKIIDFGSTKIAGIDEIQTPYERNPALGALDYAAPEYFEGHTGNPQTDIYALGAITYEMLTGKLPYGSALSLRRLKRASYTSIKHYYPEVPTWVDAAIRKAVHLDTRRRYNVTSEFVHDLIQPAAEFISPYPLPLIERNPVGVWKGLAALFFLFDLVLLYLLDK